MCNSILKSFYFSYSPGSQCERQRKNFIVQGILLSVHMTIKHRFLKIMIVKTNKNKIEIKKKKNNKKNLTSSSAKTERLKKAPR